MSVNNRPLDGEPLVKPVPGLLGETKLIGTDQFINFLESLNSTVNTQITIVMQSVESGVQLSVFTGVISANVQRIEAATAAAQQLVAQVNVSIGHLRAERQKLEERIAQVEAMCLSNRVG